MNEQVTPATVGQEFKLGRGRSVSFHTVQPKQENEDKGGGNWVCVTHKKEFHNQFQKNTHIHEGKHVLAWYCFQHGCMEVP